MARLTYHEHPRQRGACLPGAFDAYVERIPIGGFNHLEAVWQAVRRRPFESDGGVAKEERELGGRAASCGHDDRCSPVQRSRIWPPTMNCWEGTAHFVAGARKFLPSAWVVHVWDRDLSNGARHVWPSLMSPRGDHLLVDLRSTAARQYPRQAYSAVLTEPQNAANDAGDWLNQALGVVHLVGGGALRIFGLGAIADKLEDVEGDALPDWSRTQAKAETPAAEKPAEQKPASPTTQKPSKAATSKRRGRGHAGALYGLSGIDDGQPPELTRAELAALQAKLRSRAAMIKTGPPWAESTEGIDMNSSLMMMLSANGRLDAGTLHNLVARGNDKRRRLFVKLADLLFGLFMLIFGQLKLKDSDGKAIDLSKPGALVNQDLKLNALLAAADASQKSVLWRELLRPAIVNIAELIATMMEPDETMLTMLSGGMGAGPGLLGGPLPKASGVSYAAPTASGVSYAAPQVTVAPPAPPINPSAPLGSNTNPRRSSTGGL